MSQVPVAVSSRSRFAFMEKMLMLNGRLLGLCHFEVLFDGFNVKSSNNARDRDQRRGKILVFSLVWLQ